MWSCNCIVLLIILCLASFSRAYQLRDRSLAHTRYGIVLTSKKRSHLMLAGFYKITFEKFTSKKTVKN